MKSNEKYTLSYNPLIEYFLRGQKWRSCFCRIENSFRSYDDRRDFSMCILSIHISMHAKFLRGKFRCLKIDWNSKPWHSIEWPHAWKHGNAISFVNNSENCFLFSSLQQRSFSIRPFKLLHYNFFNYRKCSGKLKISYWIIKLITGHSLMFLWFIVCLSIVSECTMDMDIFCRCRGQQVH